MRLKKRLIRDGIIVGLLPIVILFLFFIFSYIKIEFYSIFQLFFYILGILGFLIVLPGLLLIQVIEDKYFSYFHTHLLSGPSGILPAPSLLGYVFIFTVYFLVGVLLVLIYEKIKNKFNKKNG